MCLAHWLDTAGDRESHCHEGQKSRMGPMTGTAREPAGLDTGIVLSAEAGTISAQFVLPLDVLPSDDPFLTEGVFAALWMRPREAPC